MFNRLLANICDLKINDIFFLLFAFHSSKGERGVAELAEPGLFGTGEFNGTALGIKF